MADTTSDMVRTHIKEVRTALNALEKGADRADRLPEGVRDLSRAVDGVRRSVWAVLEAQHTRDYASFLSRVRVRRATEVCEEVLADLSAEAVPRTTPGAEIFRGTLRELAHRCKRASQ